MKAEEFLAKFPKTEREPEESHLVDLGCPNCGDRLCIRVTATSQFELHPDGTDHDGDVEWTNESPCFCQQCAQWATVADFTHEGLDDLIEQKAEATT